VGNGKGGALPYFKFVGGLTVEEVEVTGANRKVKKHGKGLRSTTFEEYPYFSLSLLDSSRDRERTDSRFKISNLMAEN